MRKLFLIATAIFFCASSNIAYSQDRTVPQKVTHGVQTGAQKSKEGVQKGASETKDATKTAASKTKDAGKTVGNKTAEISSKTFNRVKDKKYDGKTGPGGQTIYIDKNSKYYWINGKGKKIYVAEASLKNK